MNVRSFGVEEELLLVAPETGQPRAVAGTVLQTLQHEATASGGGPDGRGGGHEAADALESELQQQQMETNTRPCRSVDELDREVRRCRSWAADAAQRAGVQVAALGTSPVSVEPTIMDKERYQEIADVFGLTAQEQLTCGCHVHVEISSEEEGVATLDRIRPWLPVLLALSANSPFWQGRDSAYASFRYQVWGRWPTSGPTPAFGSPENYRSTIEQMMLTDTALDTGMVYFDARLSEHYPTLEVRVADVCLHAADAVLVAALVRALVETEARNWRAGQPAPNQRVELLRLAAWRASRSGLDGVLLDPVTFRPQSAANVANSLLDHVYDALSDAGDADAVAELLAAVLERGNGAAFQRGAYHKTRDMRSVVTGAAALTAGY
jgi:glutamate---cysteine ligase / carboxylate-amine ligase